ncbi:MAG: PHP domain-containing protein [Clostridiales bacterium]|nr:PHP domain-containing protein [Clostridiales bacterium]
MLKIDMHVHTTASDGEFSPSEVIDYSLSKKLSGVAITDHDTTEGIDEAINHASNFADYLVVPGIELSSEYYGEEIHILGYFIDHKSVQLNKMLADLKEARVLRAKKIVYLLNQEGIKIHFDEVEKISGADVIGRPHIAKILIKNGYSMSIQKAFQEFLVKGSKTYVPRYKLSLPRAIGIIKDAKGKVVLAHPGLIKKRELIEKIVMSHKFNGIETYYPSHSDKDVLYFEELAQKHNLICTGGSDFHQIPTDGDIHEDLGTCSTPLEVIADWKREFDLRITN